MTPEQHFRALEKMYQAAPINCFYPPRIHIEEAKAEIEIAIKPEYFHSAGATHGSVIFKLLDDAAWFAANSLEQDVFVLTTSFTTYLTRPVSEGSLRVMGRVVSKNKSQFIAEAIAYNRMDNNSEPKEVGRGNGIFVRGKFRLVDAMGYSLDEGSTENQTS